MIQAYEHKGVTNDLERARENEESKFFLRITAFGYLIVKMHLAITVKTSIKRIEKKIQDDYIFVQSVRRNKRNEP